MDGSRRAWLPVLAILLSSCGIPGLRPADPPRDLPESFNGITSAENSSQVPIDEFFSDPTLTELIYEGFAGNLNLKILSENIQIANNEILKRRGAYLPFVTVGGSPSLSKYSTNTLVGADNAQDITPRGGNFPAPIPDFLMSADLSWQIDIWRQLRTARDAQVFRYLGTIEGRNYVITRFVSEIADNYFLLMGLDRRIQNLDNIITLQQQSLVMARAKKAAGQGTELAVQRFLAEVRKNQAEKLIIRQEIVETENIINFLLGRFPQAVERNSDNFLDLMLHKLDVGIPAELLQNRPDIREAERDLTAAGLDITVARYNFYPKAYINAEVGYEAYNTRFLILTPESLIYTVGASFISPLINKLAIKAEYMNANATQLQAVYNYQRTVLNAFTEVINRVAKVQNYTRSIELKTRQLRALELSVEYATNLFQAGRVEYMDVLFAQRDLMDARMVLIDTKRQQLSAIVNTYQALGGGLVISSNPNFDPSQLPGFMNPGFIPMQNPPGYVEIEAPEETPEGAEQLPPADDTPTAAEAAPPTAPPENPNQ